MVSEAHGPMELENWMVRSYNLDTVDMGMSWGRKIAQCLSVCTSQVTPFLTLVPGAFLPPQAPGTYVVCRQT